MRNRTLFIFAIIVVLVIRSSELLAVPVSASGNYKTARLFQMFDWTGKYPDDWPSAVFFTWEATNPSYGVYDWSRIDATLETTDLPLHLLLIVSTSVPNEDYTPQWVYTRLVNQGVDLPTYKGKYVGYKLERCGSVFVTPRYDSYSWKAAFQDFLCAFGQRYDGDQRIDSVVVSLGLDGEPQIAKTLDGCDWMAEVRKIPGLEYHFEKVLYDVMETYADAFPRTPLYMQVAVGGEAKAVRAKKAVELGMGLKHAGLQVDMPTWESERPCDLGTGSWDAMECYRSTANLWVESKSGLGNEESYYWSLLTGLSYNPVGMSLHPEYFEVLPERFLAWVNEHTGVPLEELISVWIVMRDAEYPESSWTGSDGVKRTLHGKLGDIGQGINALLEGPRVWRSDMPDIPAKEDKRSRQYRQGKIFEFDVADEYFSGRGYSIMVTWLDYGTGTWTIAYMTDSGVVQKKEIPYSNSGTWRVSVIPADHYVPEGAPDLWVVGPVALHKVEVVSWDNVFNETPTVAPTYSPTITPAPTYTYTPTPPPPPPTPTPTVTSTPTSTPIETATPTIGEIIEELRYRIAVELDVPSAGIRIVIEY